MADEDSLPAYGRVEAVCLPMNSDARALGEGELGHLPCTIGYTGPARTEEYFLSRPHKAHRFVEPVADKREQVVEASFRGRLLLGKEVYPPEGYQFALYAENGEGAGHCTRYSPFANAGDVVVWNQELEPAATAPLRQALGSWPIIAEAVCSPLLRSSPFCC